MAGTTTTCDIVIDPSSINAAMYYGLGAAGLLFMGIAGFVGRKRRCITCNTDDSGKSPNNYKMQHGNQAHPLWFSFSNLCMQCPDNAIGVI